MARIRTIKPELFTHDTLFDAEAESGLPVRFAFAGLLTTVDRDGRFKWKPRVLKVAVLPYDDLDFESVLDTLVNYGFIQKYGANGKIYGSINSFVKHQNINSKEAKSEIPAPEEGVDLSHTCKFQKKHRDNSINEYSNGQIYEKIPVKSEKQAISTVPELNPDSTEISIPDTEISIGKGKERKGKEGDICEVGSEEKKEVSCPADKSDFVDLENQPVSAEKINQEQERLAGEIITSGEISIPNEALSALEESPDEPDNSLPEKRSLDNPPTSPSLVKNKASKQAAAIHEVFEHWKQVMNHPKAMLDAARKKKIKSRLDDGYDSSTLKIAIDGCAASDWHMGKNDRHKIFDGIGLIFRDAEHVDDFIKITEPGVKKTAESTAQTLRAFPL